ncbi:MAG: hypothetical protein B6241_14010 [Spirochaetaceae bacterium 4572_59]|nr:MAG: hypothetical protein B6241_14010 [Spirochaetaceae bacterium 4572_59]
MQEVEFDYKEHSYYLYNRKLNYKNGFYMEKVSKRVESYVKHLNYGKVFTFETVRFYSKNAARDTITHALKKEMDNNRIIHIRKGLYAKPELSRFGSIPVSPEKVVSAMAREFRANISPSGASALNALGLTTQLPMSVSYISTKRISSFSYSSGEVKIRYSQAFEKAVSCFRGTEKSEKENAILLWISLEYLGKQEAFQKRNALKAIYSGFSEKTRNKFIKSLGRKQSWAESLFK